MEIKKFSHFEESDSDFLNFYPLIMKKTIVSLLILKLATVLASANLMIDGTLSPPLPLAPGAADGVFPLSGSAVPDSNYSVSVRYPDNTWTEPHTDFSLDLSNPILNSISVRNPLDAVFSILEVALVPESDYASFQVGKSIRPLLTAGNSDYTFQWSNNPTGDFVFRDFGDPVGGVGVADSGSTFALLFAGFLGMWGVNCRRDSRRA